MTTTIFVLIILYGIYRWSVSWIEYYSKLDTRLGSSIWKYSYDYHVVGKRDVTLEDDKNLVILRRKRNRIITLMYSIVLIMFMLSMSLLSEIMIFFLA